MRSKEVTCQRIAACCGQAWLLRERRRLFLLFTCSSEQGAACLVRKTLAAHLRPATLLHDPQVLGPRGPRRSDQPTHRPPTVKKLQGKVIAPEAE